MTRWARGRLTAAVVAVALTAVGLSVAEAAPASTVGRAAPLRNVSHDFVPGNDVAAGGRIHGITLTEGNRPFDVDLADMARVAQDGVNTVDLYITEYQSGQFANTVQDGTYTPTTAEVVAAVELAHAQGLAVELMPIVWCSQETDGKFVYRPYYNPSNRAQWFASYTTMIDKWAKVAQATGAELFSVGSEYETIEPQTRAWRAVIASVRSLYSGELIYMADAGSFYKVRFWNDLDDIGVSPYFTVSDDAVPAVRPMVRRWHNVVLPQIKAVARRWHKPVLFDELGYQSIEGAGFLPYADRSGTPSEQAQANAYQAAIDATEQLPYLRGLVFFTWSTPDLPSMDTGYTPESKLAECVLARSWASPDATTINGQLPACTIAKIGQL